MFGIWLAVAEGALLGFEAQRVIALRAMKIAAMVTVWPAVTLGSVITSPSGVLV